MEKPFDTAALVEKLKAEGLPMAEDIAQKAVAVVFEWVSESCAIHENDLVKSIGVPAIALIKPIVDGQLDKLDGVIGK